MAQTSQDESKDASSPETVILPKQDRKFAPFDIFLFFSIRKMLLYPNNSKEQEIS